MNAFIVVFRYLFNVLPHSPGEYLGEMKGQLAYVLSALSQGWKHDRKDVPPIVKITADARTRVLCLAYFDADLKSRPSWVSLSPAIVSNWEHSCGATLLQPSVLPIEAETTLIFAPGQATPALVFSPSNHI